MDAKRKTWGASLDRKPRMSAGRDRRWVGEWELVDGWTYDGEKTMRGKFWTRERLELDGHEDCCQHQWPVFIEVGEWVEEDADDGRS